jgi:hypothetical protein
MVKLPFKNMPKLYNIMETWKTCFENYEISNLGNCRRLLKSGKYKIINGSILKTGGGYLYLQINREGKRTNLLFHHLVASQFIGERPEGLVIDHIDRNKLNNAVDNLRYITQKENCFNQDRVISEIPQDIPDRKRIVAKKWSEENRDIILKKKNDYYYKNRDEISKKMTEKCVELICDKCNKPRMLTKAGAYARKKSGRNICGLCSSIENLELVNQDQSKK